jgi:hypothetical protein
MHTHSIDHYCYRRVYEVWGARRSNAFRRMRDGFWYLYSRKEALRDCLEMHYRSGREAEN